MPNWLLALLLGGGVAVVLGYFVARKAEQRKPIHGGNFVRFIHYLGAVAGVAPSPIILIGALVLRVPFIESLAMCAGSVLVSLGLMLVFAVFEIRAPQKSA